ncbi:MAG: peptidoglycan-binding domain-containing protein [Haliscomenobacter sp.]|uniref:peptidoglycan-binding domain-containing protein n=1 Tax=Haliscomenobacter sp. TaxID=2717303 RepID=UPI0029A33AD0|nr:peptidoglycan-binding domain-containing protein [Haliscomenobacter sp.]MDX2068209.1 peptidoglycan-binding domain-containing protein [Haliscomenobacter sp.]
MNEKTIEELKEKIHLQELEIEFLRKKMENDSKFDENKEKAIKLEILKEAKIDTNKRLLTLIPLLGIILSVFGFFGYENIKTSLLKQIDIEPLKKKVLAAAKSEITDIERTKSKIQKLEEEVITLVESTKKHYEEISSLAQAVEVNKKNAESIIEALDPETKNEIERKLRNRFLDESGLSTEFIISILQKETGFHASSLAYSDLKKSVSQLQSKYGLRPDGVLGPATSLLIMAIAVKYKKIEALRDIQENGSKRPFLSYPFLFSEHGLFEIIKSDRHELHEPMLDVLKVTDNINSLSEALVKIERY